jgi:hypothetical protein
MKQIWRWMGMVGLLGLGAGCGGAPQGEPVTVARLAERLVDPLWLARLDQEDTRIHTSYDRTGGNNDYATFLRDSRDPGWKVVVDLKGPGYVSRVWFTGAKDGEPHRFRFYFDGEETPRFEGDIKVLFGGKMAPFLAPLAEYNNYCWYSFIPMPYEKSLRIECEVGPPEANGGPRKVYYQISESPLPRRTPVETFAWPLPDRDIAAIGKARALWMANRLPEAGELREQVVADWKVPVRLDGPGVIRRIEFEPQWGSIPEDRRDAVLRDWMVAIRYDGATNDSVQVPLGDLCGTPWRRVRARSLYFGMEGDSLFCAFPMPFARSAEIQLRAGVLPPVPVVVRTWVEAREESPMGEWGYFHANWRRTTPNDAGRPHPILRVQGRGKFVGCLLSVVALDGSYWVLEGDESIRKDREKTPGWLGTGLEDYFNGGWYYQNVMAGPTHGLPVKEAFRTVQYRVHSMDPTQFSESLDMEFERGPDQVSKAFFESVGWAYLDRPQTADTMRLRAEDRAAPQDLRLDPAVVMSAIWNHERFGDWQGARDELAGRLRRHGAQYSPSARRMLEFRLALYEEKLGGPDPLPQFRDDPDENVRTAAEMFRRQRDAGAALAVFYANMPARLFLNGREVMQAGHPEKPVVASFDLPPGRHLLAIQAPRQRYPDWVQLALRGRNWFAGTDTSWKFAFNPPGEWALPDYDDSNWRTLEGTGVKGPPEEPFIWVEPDPFLDMQSRAVGIRPSGDWPSAGGLVVYRKEIVVP